MSNPTPEERADLIFHDLADPNKQDETIRETVERHIREAVVQAEAVTVERCAREVELDICNTYLSQSAASRIRALQPSPDWLAEHDNKVRAATVEVCAEHYIQLGTDGADLCVCGMAVVDWPQHIRSISPIDISEHDRKVRLDEHFNSCSSHSPDSFDSTGMMVEPIWCSKEHPCVKAQRLIGLQPEGFCVRHGADCRREDCNPIRVDLPKEPTR